MSDLDTPSLFLFSHEGHLHVIPSVITLQEKKQLREVKFTRKKTFSPLIRALRPCPFAAHPAQQKALAGKNHPPFSNSATTLSIGNVTAALENISQSIKRKVSISFLASYTFNCVSSKSKGVSRSATVMGSSAFTL